MENSSPFSKLKNWSIDRNQEDKDKQNIETKSRTNPLIIIWLIFLSLTLLGSDTTDEDVSSAAYWAEDAAVILEERVYDLESRVEDATTTLDGRVEELEMRIDDLEMR